jgi:hypothetical protein
MLDGMQELVRDFDAERSKLYLQTAEYVRFSRLTDVAADTTFVQSIFWRVFEST